MITQTTPCLPLPVSTHQAAPQCTANAGVQLTTLTTHLSTPRGFMAELAMLADIQWTVNSEVTRQLHVNDAGQGNFAGHG